jgi:LacI family transcriptional regulator
MSQPTVYDVAEKAGVSTATVSRVLNSSNNVSSPTRIKVLEAIQELGFVPKAEAVARARSRHGRIGVMAPFFTQPSFAQRLHGVATVLADSPYELVVYTVDSSSRRDAYLSSLQVSPRVDGLIVMALPFGASIGERLQANNLETVMIECSLPFFTSIEIDDRAGGRMAAEHFLQQGHRRFGFVGDTDLPDYAIYPSDRRLEGYRDALASAGHQLPDACVALAPHGRGPAYHSAQRLLDLADPPTAIFAASDTQAMGVLWAARERGLEVPRDLCVIGFDDLEIAEYIGLTTVSQQLEGSGRLAAELLLARLGDGSRPIQHIRLPLTFIKRQTA